ncbi:hypothetical protein PINS_up010479 [Pythium insidiosum]|nr:hypothetical protein PINS_up010479 [Pythium insidiosum]
MEDAVRKRKARGDDDGDAQQQQQRRGAGRHEEDEDAVLPLLSALQRAKKPKTRPKTSPLKTTTTTTASEFVDVEVGLRELQKRLNAAASRGKRESVAERTTATSTSSSAAPEDGDERAKKSTSKAATGKSTRKKTVETSGDSATTASATTSPSIFASCTISFRTNDSISVIRFCHCNRASSGDEEDTNEETKSGPEIEDYNSRDVDTSEKKGNKHSSHDQGIASWRQDKHDDPPSKTNRVALTPVCKRYNDTSFIPDDFDEDLAFLQALDEVERKLQPQAEPLISSPATHTSPERSLSAHTETFVVSQPIKSEPVTDTDTTSAVMPAVSSPSKPALSGPKPIAALEVPTTSAAEIIHDQQEQQDPQTQLNQPMEQEADPQKEEDDLQPQQQLQTPGGEPLKQPLADQTVVPLTILEEFERLKRENEELRRSNAMLQASGVKNVEQGQVRAESDVGKSKQSEDPADKHDMSVAQQAEANDAKTVEDDIVSANVAHRQGDDSCAATTQHDPSVDTENELDTHDVDMENDDCEDVDAMDDIETSTVDRGNYSEYKLNKSHHDSDEGDAMEIDDESNGEGVTHDAMERDQQRLDGMEGDNAVAEGHLSRRSLGHHDTSSRSSSPVTGPNGDNGCEVDIPTTSCVDATVHSDTESERDEEELVPVTISPGRRRVSVSSSSSSSSNEASEDDEEIESSQGVNGLEAALRAATGKSSSSVHQRERSVSTVSVDSSHSATSSPPKSVVNQTKRKPQKPRADPKDKSTLLWPTLDEFYDVILELSPRAVRTSDRDNRNRSSGCNIESPMLRDLERKRARLPSTYSTLGQYQALQREAILEELVSAVRSAEDLSQYHATRASLWLTSISPCGRQSMTSTVTSLSRYQQMNDQSIFLESALSSTAKNDVILTFQDTRPVAERRQRRNVLQGFVGGDLVHLRSPSSRGMEISAFGIVLCSSAVAIGGESTSSSSKVGNAPADPREDQLCVLLRGPDVDSEKLGRWTALLEMCLVNQRSSSWIWTLEQVHNLTTSAREYQAIQSLRFMPSETTKMLLQGTTTSNDSFKLKSESSSTSSAMADVALSTALEQELRRKYNDSQLAAIHGAVDQRRMLSIIQGPPGTGKTKTILGVLSALLDGAALSATRQAKVKSRIRVGASLQQHSSTVATDQKSVAQSSIRILVAAPSNAAVDELIVRLMSEGIFDARMRKTYRPRLVRVGRPESLQQQQRSGNERDVLRKKKWRKYAAEVEEILLESLVNRHRSAFPTVRQARQSIIQNAQIVFCTLSGAGSLAMCELAQHRFDALVIDEAAQAVEASTLIPFKFQPSRIVLVGDHQQLPATVISKRLVELGYDRSLFQRLVERGSKVFLLTQQYRMHPEISWFPSTYFYRGQLVEAAAMKDWTARKYHQSELFRPFVFVDVPTGQQSQVSGSKSLRNLSEIDVIISLLQRLVVEKFPELDWKRKIGIISPYKQQIVELRGELQRWEARGDLQLDIEVNTVDGFQGREKEIIIYSCVRTARSGSSRSKSSGSEAFWADERRMNVAITRAKSSLWIIGNSLLLSQSAAWRALLQHAKDTRRFIPESALEAKGIVVRS